MSRAEACDMANPEKPHSNNWETETSAVWCNGQKQSKLKTNSGGGGGGGGGHAPRPSLLLRAFILSCNPTTSYLMAIVAI